MIKNHSLFKPKRQTQSKDIQEDKTKMSMNLLKGTNEKQQQLFRSQKIRSTFYTEDILPKLPFKLKDWVAAEDKNNIVF